MKHIEDLDINNKRVIIRVDYNVPIQDAQIQNDYRILKSLKTINYCIDNNASVILISHLGRPKGIRNEKYSLELISWYLEDILDREVKFVDDCISKEAIIMSKKLMPKEIMLLENLRFYNEELDNDNEFCNNLSKLGDVYVNDAFGTTHRSHASNVGLAGLFNQKGYGYLIEDEIKYLRNSIDQPASPLTFVIGGAKISTKISLIENIISKADMILIGGGMAFTFLKSLGYNIGKSLVEENQIKAAKGILDRCKKKNVSIQLPSDIVCASDISNPDTIDVKSIDSIKEDEMGLDIGPETCINYDMFIQSSKTIIWNGPLGLFENSYFSTGTQAIAASILDAKNNNNAIAIIGGGDTVSAIENFNSDSTYSHISTGGGSALELLSGKKLPALIALEK